MSQANAVELSNVQQKYSDLTVLNDINLSLKQGEVLGLFGHNGAGKTTTVKLILGLLNPSSGRVSVLGGDANDADIRRQIGFLPENVTFYPHLTGLETLTHFSRLKGAPIQQVHDLLEQVGLAAAAKARVKTYSKGMRQRLGLAQALLGNPKLLILDEPTVGLDPIATQALYQLMQQLKDNGTSIIICSHVLPGVEPYIDRAAVLARGKLEAIGTLHELRQQASLPVRVRVLAERPLELAHTGILQRQQLSNRWQEFQVLPAAKLEILEQLLQQRPEDLEVSPPSLEDLYIYYMQQAGAVGAAGVQI